MTSPDADSYDKAAGVLGGLAVLSVVAGIVVRQAIVAALLIAGTLGVLILVAYGISLRMRFRDR